MAKYRYRIIAGAGVFSPHLSMRECLRRYPQIRQAFPTYPIEIERVLEMGDARRYWLWRGGKWVLWSAAAIEPSAADLVRWHTKGRTA